jgi:hypothetical protein
MMQLARRASLAVVLLLLASVGTASAECAWVLWSWLPSGRLNFVFAYDSRSDCEVAGPRLMAHNEAAGLKKLGYLCVPDTVDPRGPKTK